MRAVRTRSPEPSHGKILASAAALLRWVDSRRCYTWNSLRQRNHHCAHKRCKSPPAGMQRSHDWNDRAQRLVWIPQTQADPSRHEERTNRQTNKEAKKQAGTHHKDVFGGHFPFPRWLNTTKFTNEKQKCVVLGLDGGDEHFSTRCECRVSSVMRPLSSGIKQFFWKNT